MRIVNGGKPFISVSSGVDVGSSNYNRFGLLSPNDNTGYTPGADQSAPEVSTGSASGSPTDYNILEYLEGLFASVGAENEVNRLYNSAEAKANREFQSQEARIQREWYEAMSNSAYQRSVADMRAAGINPILAYQQGGAASSGTGVPTGSAAAYQVGGGDTLTSVLGSVADLVSAFKGSGSKVSSYDILKILAMLG